MEGEDSVMNYIKSSGQDFIVLPNPFANLARFISGINNVRKDLKLPSTIKRNLESFQFRIDEKIHIMLYTRKFIKKNEILAYDYNNGQRKNKEDDMYQTIEFD
jgi:hypothetical protein